MDSRRRPRRPSDSPERSEPNLDRDPHRSNSTKQAQKETAPKVDLYEYQGKQYFSRFGIPVSPGGVADTVDEAVAQAFYGLLGGDELGDRGVGCVQDQLGVAKDLVLVAGGDLRELRSGFHLL